MCLTRDIPELEFATRWEARRDTPFGKVRFVDIICQVSQSPYSVDFGCVKSHTSAQVRYVETEEPDIESKFEGVSDFDSEYGFTAVLEL